MTKLLLAFNRLMRFIDMIKVIWSWGRYMQRSRTIRVLLKFT